MNSLKIYRIYMIVMAIFICQCGVIYQKAEGASSGQYSQFMQSSWGIWHWGNTYLDSGIPTVRDLGSNVVLVVIGPTEDKENYYKCDNETNLTGRVQRDDYKNLLNSFSTIVFMAGEFSAPCYQCIQPTDPNTPNTFKNIENEMYSFAYYLLSTYKNTGKTFVIQTFEGEHIGAPSYADTFIEPYSCDTTTTNSVNACICIDYKNCTQTLINIYNARQRGISRAKMDAGSASGVTLYNALEIVRPNIKMPITISLNTTGSTTTVSTGSTILNRVLPYLTEQPDLISYSSFHSLNDCPTTTITVHDCLMKDLDSIQSIFAEYNKNPAFGSHSVMISQYAWGATSSTSSINSGFYNAGAYNDIEKDKEAIRAAYDWKVPYMGYWRLQSTFSQPTATTNYCVLPSGSGDDGWGLITQNGYKRNGWCFYQEGLKGKCNWTPLAPKDFTGNHKADFILFGETSDTWMVKDSSSLGSQSADIVFGPWARGIDGWKPLAPADFGGNPNGTADGKSDFVSFLPGTGTWMVKYSSDLNSIAPDIIFGPWARGVDGWTPLAPADFNRDGRADFVSFLPGTGTWIVKYSSNLNSIAPDINFGPWARGVDGWTPLAPADFNGDGRADFVAYLPGIGTWLVKYSSSNLKNLAPDINFGPWARGVDGWTPLAPADFNKDGRADFVAYRASDGMWMVKYSSNLGNINSNIVFGPWAKGVDGWIPLAPADFNGDGIPDFVAYRPSDGMFIVKYTSNLGSLISDIVTLPHVWDFWF